ncbi:MAG: phenylalanine--tRNA ligase subunit beta [Gammaproteobacteria bacterium]|nr:phenylalanine--tRNA ligase subunit beta [Gammaproteobacteria bacterium]
MKFSESWLREWVNPSIATDELLERLTMAGLEVDGVEPAAAEFSGVLIGEVKTLEAHPDADKLRVCTVDVGVDEPLQIVCGAPNVRVGMKAPVATVGGRLPGGIKIKKAKLRGMPSHGMMCSVRELGIADEDAGLMDLPADAPVGMDIREYLQLDDQVIEVDLTPNRGDCLGIAGVAREVATLCEIEVNVPSIDEVNVTLNDELKVSVSVPEACPRYLGRVIKGIDVSAPTPIWMQERLRRAGLRSIDVVVDITNYVLLEWGQPMHAFDLAKLDGGLDVRYASEGETLGLLDGKDINLTSDTLVIADQKAVRAIAGIMGGASSGVSLQTRDLFLECAFFSPLTIAGKARSYGMQTDSSHRFERGVDPQLQALAMQRATGLLLDLAGGEAGSVTEICSQQDLPQQKAILLRRQRIMRVLGIEPGDAEVESILQRLGMVLQGVDDGWEVTAPSFRFDIAIEADLIEEIARVYGYNQLPSRRPVASMNMRAVSEQQVSVDQLRDLMVHRGYQEAISYSFVDPEMQVRLHPGQEAVSLANPISSEMSVMRVSLWSGLLKALEYNVNRQQSRVRLFEYGMRFVPQGDDIKQDNIMSGVLYGARDPEQWSASAAKFDFYDVKNDVEALLDLASCHGRLVFQAANHPALHPGQTADILLDGNRVGCLGRIHPGVAKDLGVPEQVYLFELERAAIQQGNLAHYKTVSKFPAIRRDLAIIVDEAVSAQQIMTEIRSCQPDYLQDMILFDIYQGKGIEIGLKSVALGLILQDYSRTLTDEDVDRVITKVTAHLTNKLAAKLRD